MDLKYVKGSYMDEIMCEGKPVLFMLEGWKKAGTKKLAAMANTYGNGFWRTAPALWPTRPSSLILKIKNGGLTESPKCRQKKSAATCSASILYM